MLTSTNCIWMVLLLLSSIGHDIQGELIVNSDDSTILPIFAHILCRHGDRNPYASYPNDPYKSEEFWPGGYGALTPMGMERSYELGQYLSQRYSRITNGKYSPDDIYIFSTDNDRTLMSAESILAGFFPPTDDQIWNKDLDWQPIPVHTIPKTNEITLKGSKQCDRLEYLVAEYLNEDDRFNKLIEKHRTMIDYAKEKSGRNESTIMDLAFLWNTLVVEDSMGFEIPDWGKELIEPGGELETFNLDWYPINSSTPEMQRLGPGILLKEILDRFTDKLESRLSPDRSLWLYSVHETTMIALLNSLGLFEPTHVPPYGSCLFIELFQNEDNPYVQLFYRNTTETSVPLLRFPNCPIECPLRQMYELYDDIFLSESYESECALRDGETMPLGGNPANSFI